MEIKKAPLIRKPNYMLIPTTQIERSSENMELFNNEVERCKEYNKIKRTPSGGISYRTRIPAYDVRCTSSNVELTVLDKDGMFRLQFRSLKKETPIDSGHKSFIKFKKLCLKYGINLDNYIVNNGAEIKKDIEKYIIQMGSNRLIDKTFTAHHLDFHSSFPSGLVATHPEFKDVIEELYNGRKEHQEYKFILNSTIGYMQSEKCCKAKWAGLAKDAINNNNERIRDIAHKLLKSGHMILAFNTDGIWYTGDVYHDENEGNTIGTWSNDHINTTIRFKSAGAYEYIENGIYTPVVRGHTLLDNEKSRENWKWGDIYLNDANPLKYGLTEDDKLVII